MAKPALIELRENAIKPAGILENIFGDSQKIDWPAIQDVADDTAQTIEKPHDTPLGSFAVHHKRLHLLNEPQMNKGDHCFRVALDTAQRMPVSDAIVIVTSVLADDVSEPPEYRSIGPRSFGNRAGPGAQT
ncbi:hypothetical protein [Rhizobium ruizarguesonis]|jgi:hypothetical protein|uniref:hypothetical protein n=1 Tax=Rhizobium ruizarguesonis TaxID=2081791 RepID=UPI0018D51E23|nr:hypothetical protein [Rhizobium ruizarguesonis]